MSHDAHPGANRTVSPGAAMAAAAATTSAMAPVSVRVTATTGRSRGVSRQRVGDHLPIGAQQHHRRPSGRPRLARGRRTVGPWPARRRSRPPGRRPSGRSGGVAVRGLGVIDVVHPGHVADASAIRCPARVKARSPSRTAVAGTPWARASAAAARALATLWAAAGRTSATVASSWAASRRSGTKARSTSMPSTTPSMD